MEHTQLFEHREQPIAHRCAPVRPAEATCLRGHLDDGSHHQLPSPSIWADCRESSGGRRLRPSSQAGSMHRASRSSGSTQVRAIWTTATKSRITIHINSVIEVTASLSFQQRTPRRAVRQFGPRRRMQLYPAFRKRKRLLRLSFMQKNVVLTNVSQKHCSSLQTKHTSIQQKICAVGRRRATNGVTPRGQSKLRES